MGFLFSLQIGPSPLQVTLSQWCEALSDCDCDELMFLVKSFDGEIEKMFFEAMSKKIPPDGIDDLMNLLIDSSKDK